MRDTSSGTVDPARSLTRSPGRGTFSVLLPVVLRDWRGSFISWRRGMTENIAVFLDFQNVHFVSRGVEPYRCVPNPARLADLIADRRRSSSTAAKINVYRGRPDPERQPTLTAANDAQAAYWTRDRRVQLIRRQLNYRGWPDLAPREKGIDVKLAVDLMRTAFAGDYDALILFSSDTDLLPALEAVAEDGLGHVEVAYWTGGNILRFPGTNLPWHHALGRRDWAAVIEDWQNRF
jgi:uncharacterized LabA/DUF88 family protein